MPKKLSQEEFIERCKKMLRKAKVIASLFILYHVK